MAKEQEYGALAVAAAGAVFAGGSENGGEVQHLEHGYMTDDAFAAGKSTALAAAVAAGDTGVR